MVILHVHARVQSEHLDAFRDATRENARNSVQEAGVLRFDVVQQSDEPTRFVLVEVYRDEAAIEAHRQSAHYAKWRELVEPMMAEPRSRTLFKAVFPDEENWR
jgi:autoinducer 2-degrading protein